MMPGQLGCATDHAISAVFASSNAKVVLSFCWNSILPEFTDFSMNATTPMPSINMIRINAAPDCVVHDRPTIVSRLTDRDSMARLA